METKWANQRRRSRNSYPSVGGPLDNGDKARICILAKEAFLKTELIASPENFAEWRRQEQLAAVGKESLRDCTKRDLLKLVAHFENLAGESGRAVKTHLRDATQETAMAMHKLTAECRARRLDLSYAAKICRNKFKCTLEEASSSQLWKLFFDIKTSGHKKMECPF